MIVHGSNTVPNVFQTPRVYLKVQKQSNFIMCKPNHLGDARVTRSHTSETRALWNAA